LKKGLNILRTEESIVVNGQKIDMTIFYQLQDPVKEIAHHHVAQQVQDIETLLTLD
jgi:hypothetical protein